MIMEKKRTLAQMNQALFVRPPPGSTPSLLNIIARINPPMYPPTVATERI